MQPRIKDTIQYNTHLNPFPTDNFKKYSKKTYIEIINSEIFLCISTLSQSRVTRINMAL